MRHSELIILLQWQWKSYINFKSRPNCLKEIQATSFPCYSYNQGQDIEMDYSLPFISANRLSSQSIDGNKTPEAAGRAHRV